MPSTFISEKQLSANTAGLIQRIVERQGEEFYVIENYDNIEPFFISLVSHSDHWMFIGSNGGLSAGRQDENNALFPYYTDDKIIASAGQTGPVTFVKLIFDEKAVVWFPFSDRYKGIYRIKRTLYKSKWGNSLIFEEENRDLEMIFRYSWRFSEKYGFVRSCELINTGKKDKQVELLDGLKNLLPYGVDSDMQKTKSNLVNAYKRNELDESGLGIYALSAMIIDRAEPSEALRATICWSTGVKSKEVLLSEDQIEKFMWGEKLKSERDKKGVPGAYLINFNEKIEPSGSKKWKIIADLEYSQPKIRDLIQKINSHPDQLNDEIDTDLSNGTESLKSLVAKADGLQYSANKMVTGRHYSNVLFNIMRGGLFEDDYSIEKEDLLDYLDYHNHSILDKHKAFFEKLPGQMIYGDLLGEANKTKDKDLIRLCFEYLPLSFSRRHGDPSRPWNKFSINLVNEVGKKERFYQGNWRDIFQNWEALAYSFPGFTIGMITKFLNASTADGYNPYRISRNGIDWEIADPNDPWSYIGYWGDHQIIYLLKLLEVLKDHFPEELNQLLDKDHFVYANVPYRIAGFESILNDPKNTVTYHEELAGKIEQRVNKIGADGKLILSDDAKPFNATFLEKILVTWLTKISNFVPDAGIWLNTQRPEWNDANNALVGNGTSMVTLFYLFRFTNFLKDLLSLRKNETFKIHKEVFEFFDGCLTSLSAFEDKLTNGFDDKTRLDFTRKIGMEGEIYRESVYQGFSGELKNIGIDEILSFSDRLLNYFDGTIANNMREDGLCHSYNIIQPKSDALGVSYLYEMLEGQVAILTSGYLTPERTLKVLDALKSSKMYREDQYSYLLYPNRELPGFLSKNHIPEDVSKKIDLFTLVKERKDKRLVEWDQSGRFYFNGNIHNANDVARILDTYKEEGIAVSEQVRNEILSSFEQLFDHRSFTGRSGTFFGYEGLGSIYWHMVSKLLLSVQESIGKAISSQAKETIKGRLIDHYYEIRAGIGINKDPEVYGAFPTDPYSHTPFHRGAQQPGMTGQVKEDIINRWAELGVMVREGKVRFSPQFLDEKEFLKEPGSFIYFDLKGKRKLIKLSNNEIGFTYNQVPVIYKLDDRTAVRLVLNDGNVELIEGTNELSESYSSELFSRSGKIKEIHVSTKKQ